MQALPTALPVLCRMPERCTLQALTLFLEPLDIAGRNRGWPLLSPDVQVRFLSGWRKPHLYSIALPQTVQPQLQGTGFFCYFRRTSWNLLTVVHLVTVVQLSLSTVCVYVLWLFYFYSNTGYWVWGLELIICPLTSKSLDQTQVNFQALYSNAEAIVRPQTQLMPQLNVSPLGRRWTHFAY